MLSIPQCSELNWLQTQINMQKYFSTLNLRFLPSHLLATLLAEDLGLECSSEGNFNAWVNTLIERFRPDIEPSIDYFNVHCQALNLDIVDVEANNTVGVINLTCLNSGISTVFEYDVPKNDPHYSDVFRLLSSQLYSISGTGELSEYHHTMTLFAVEAFEDDADLPIVDLSDNDDVENFFNAIADHEYAPGSVDELRELQLHIKESNTIRSLKLDHYIQVKEIDLSTASLRFKEFVQTVIRIDHKYKSLNDGSYEVPDYSDLYDENGVNENEFMPLQHAYVFHSGTQYEKEIVFEIDGQTNEEFCEVYYVQDGQHLTHIIREHILSIARDQEVLNAYHQYLKSSKSRYEPLVQIG
jgi:hypothetical protein